MLFAALKAAISGVLIATISEVTKRSPHMGALIASLPIISVMAMIWMWHESGDTNRIADHAQSTFWLVLPSLPMFLVLPALLRSGVHFYLSLILSCLLTVALYAVMIWVLKKFSITF